MEAKLNPLFEAAVKEKKIPGIGYFIIDAKGNFLAKGSFGSTHIQDPDAAAFDFDTTMTIFSCTKLITTIAALQLAEQGKLSLDDPVEKYVPRISKIQVLETTTPGADGKYNTSLRAAKAKPTVMDLITHTGGFSYDFFDHATLAWRMASGRAPLGYHSIGDWEDWETPYLFEPGSKYCYGINIDWLGWVIEAVSGESLPDYLVNHICKPLGMNETDCKRTPGKKNTAVVHFDVEGQGLVGNPASYHNESPQAWGGGGFLYSTLNDYSKLLATLLNNGTSPTTGKSILKPETVKDLIFTDQLKSSVDKSDLGEIGASIPIASLEGTLLPSMPVSEKGWSTGLLLNHVDLPYGRKAGSGTWAGLGNLFYCELSFLRSEMMMKFRPTNWNPGVDPKTGIAGMAATSILPFLNPTFMRLFDEVERVAYGHDIAGEGGVDDKKRNYMAKAKAAS